MILVEYTMDFFLFLPFPNNVIKHYFCQKPLLQPDDDIVIFETFQILLKHSKTRNEKDKFLLLA